MKNNNITPPHFNAEGKWTVDENEFRNPVTFKEREFIMSNPSMGGSWDWQEYLAAGMGAVVVVGLAVAFFTGHLA